MAIQTQWITKCYEKASNNQQLSETLNAWSLININLLMALRIMMNIIINNAWTTYISSPGWK